MQLHHHSKQDYATANAEAAEDARKRFQRRIDEGQVRAAQLIDHLGANVPEDMIARHERLAFRFGPRHAAMPALDLESASREGLTDDTGMPIAIAALLDEAPVTPPTTDKETDEIPSLLLDVADGTRVYGVHDHALSQMAARAKVPVKYLKELVRSSNPALRDLALEILGTHYGPQLKLGEERSLLRSIDGETRGFLSAQYKRIDCLPVLEAFIDEAVKTHGCVPTDAVGTSLRAQLKVVLPEVFFPTDDSPILVGLAWSNSDYGVGANCLALTIERLWCTNKATTTDVMREIHLGKKLPDDIAWSEQTRAAETELSVLTIRDAVKHVLRAENIDGIMTAIRTVSERKIEWKQVGSELKALTKGERETAQQLFEGEETVLLPAGRTQWRASNVLSLMAQSASSAERRLNLEREAGRLMETGALAQTLRNQRQALRVA